MFSKLCVLIAFISVVSLTYSSYRFYKERTWGFWKHVPHTLFTTLMWGMVGIMLFVEYLKATT